MRPSDRSFARRIDLTSLQLFVAVCEQGSIGKAVARDFSTLPVTARLLVDHLTARAEAPVLAAAA